MKLVIIFTTIAALAGCAGPTATMFTDGGEPVPAVAGMTYGWSFDGDPAGALPADFINVLGEWAVQPDGTLRQSGSFGDPDFPRVVVRGLTFTDQTVRVRCKPESGDTDRACGLMFRVQDSENYYITRANALEDNVRLYRVIDGDRQQFGSASLTVNGGEWHDLEITARGQHLTVSWDGSVVIEADDATFAAGKIGLWTKADSKTSFDDLEAVAE
jgi:hypothetical protein